MQKKRWSVSFAAVAWGSLFPVFFLLLRRFELLPLGDTDRFYHLALSREMARASVWYLKALPQLPVLGWSEFFPDKEFLFHVLTSLGYRLGGELGTELALMAAASAGAVLLYAGGLRCLAPFSAFGVVVATFFARSFVLRMTFLRPHVLAVFCFVLLNLGVFRRSRWVTALGCAMFALSYHALYIPIACLTLAAGIALAGPSEEKRERLLVAASGVAGLAVGILVDPAFPGSLGIAWMVARIPFLMRSGLGGIGFGMELYPLSSAGYFQFYWLPATVFGAAVYTAGRLGRGIAREYSLVYAAAITALGLGLAAMSVRGGEYLMPSAAFLAYELLARVPSARARNGIVAFVAAMQGALTIWVYCAEAGENPDARETASVFDAISTIPASDPGFVFNCEWDRGAFLYYARPDLSFLQLLDPSLLYFYNQPLFDVHQRLRKGQVADARAVLRQSFGAKYALCGPGPLVEQMKTDPGFRQLYPRPEDTRKPYAPAYFLFQVADRARPEFVRRMSASAAPVSDAAGARSLAPPRYGTSSPPVDLDDSVHLDLRPVARGMGGSLACAFVAPAESEVTRLAGAEYVGIGAEQAVRFWWNGKLQFASGRGYAQARSARTVLKIPRPLRREDRLDFLVCSGSGSPWGISISLWTPTALAAACGEKRPPAEPSGAAQVTEPRTCLGDFAVSGLPAGISGADF